MKYVPFNTQILVHAKVTQDFKCGRLARKVGQLLCEPKRESVAWSGWEMEPGTKLTCPKCRQLLGLKRTEE